MFTSIVIAATVATLTLPPYFQRTEIGPGFAEPVALDFTGDGRVLIAERCGRVVVVDGNEFPTMLQLTDITCDEEWGLLGLAVDPDFASNGFFYVFYTTAATQCRVSRFTAAGNFADLASEVIIWENPEDCGAGSHHGGHIAFAPDGTLFIATGDEFQGSPSQDLGSQRGKLLRMNKDGTVPQDNPFVGTSGADPRVWALGFRNPFRFSIDPETGSVLLGDVGLDLYEEVNLVRAGQNFGWPLMEGPMCYVSDCSSFVGPTWWYPHDDPLYAFLGQAAVICGPVYRAASFPPPYQNRLFVADHVTGWIRTLLFDPDDGHLHDEELFDAAPNAQTIVDMKVGPEGSLYYLSIFGSPIGGTGLFRVDYIGGDNVPPVAVLESAPTSGDAPLTVNFDASNSFDPDEGPDALTHLWDFGDGEFAAGDILAHSYTRRGRFIAQLTVDDGELADTERVEITVGSPPQPQILFPPAGRLYRANDEIFFGAQATDAEDGTLPPSAFSWQIRIIHDTHAHPFLGPINGVSSGSFTVPRTGHAPENTHFRIDLTVTDSDGITTSVEREIFPVIAPIAMETVPSGIPVFLDSVPISTPRTYESLDRFHHILFAPSQHLVGEVVYTFDRWEHGAAQEFEFDATRRGLSLRAVYLPACAPDVNGDGFVTGEDFDLFASLFEVGDIGADYNRDGFVTGDDFDGFIEDFSQGC